MAMEDFRLSEKNKCLMNSGSRGCQLKYKQGNKWFKINTNGYEDKAEYVSYLLLRCSNYSHYLKYYLCRINDKPGCYSEDFLHDTEELVSFERLYFTHTGKSLTMDVAAIDNVKARIQFVIDFFRNEINLDITDYLNYVISLDFLTRNGDRHFNNLAVIHSEQGYTVAPIFDNGDSFFSSYAKFDPWLSIKECVEKSSAQPFSGSFDEQFSCIENKLRINYTQFFSLLKKLDDCRYKEAATCLLNQYESVFRDDSIITTFND